MQLDSHSLTAISSERLSVRPVFALCSAHCTNCAGAINAFVSMFFFCKSKYALFCVVQEQRAVVKTLYIALHQHLGCENALGSQGPTPFAQKDACFIVGRDAHVLAVRRPRHTYN